MLTSTKKQKYYTVWKGRTPGVYTSWEACKQEVVGFEGANYKSFATYEEAQAALQKGYWQSVGAAKKKPNLIQSTYLIDSIAVDAACSGNPGDMEYRGVYIKTGSEIFHQGPFKQGTNNIGEFLALVHALAYQKKENLHLPIYSDSRNAILWVKAKKCRTKLELCAENKYLFELISRAEQWLQNNPIEVPVLKWETKAWGEIPADFGRK